MKNFIKLLSVFLSLSFASSPLFACNGDDLCDNPNCEQRSFLKKRSRPEDLFLNQAEPNKRIKHRLSLLDAATTGNIQVIQEYLESGAILSKDASGRTAYHLAAIHGQVEVVRLLSQTQLATVVDSNGNTPLHSAIAADQIQVAQLIAQSHPALARVRDHQGLTPFLLAAQTPSIEDFWVPKLNDSLRLLQQLGAISNVLAQDDQGRTALDLAWESKRNMAYRMIFNLGPFPGNIIRNLPSNVTFDERVKHLKSLGVENQNGQFRFVVDGVRFTSNLSLTEDVFTMSIVGQAGKSCLFLATTAERVQVISSQTKGLQCPFSQTEGRRIAKIICRALGVRIIN
jgi:hypothetical protein